MEFSNTRFRDVFQNFEKSVKREELEVFGSTTLKDVHTTIATIQARQETERTMMDLTRVSMFIDRMNDLSTILGTVDHTTNYMAFIWGPFKAMLHATSQDQRVLDILLDAYDKLGSTIPVLQEFQAVIDLHPELWRILELIYQDVLQFHKSALQLATHPSKPCTRVGVYLADKSRHAYSVSLYVERLCATIRDQAEKSRKPSDLDDTTHALE